MDTTNRSQTAASRFGNIGSTAGHRWHTAAGSTLTCECGREFDGASQGDSRKQLGGHVKLMADAAHYASAFAPLHGDDRADFVAWCERQLIAAANGQSTTTKDEAVAVAALPMIAVWAVAA